jgi:hypothetical protein
VTTEVQVQVTAESSSSQSSPPSTPNGSIAPVLQKPAPPAHAPWGSPDSDDHDHEPTSPPTAHHHHHLHPHNNPHNQFTTTSTISSTRPPQPPSKSLPKQLAHTWHKFRAKLATLDPIKLAYLRTSFVFAISILVTWTPSSINRVYSLIYPARTSYGLNLAGAVVLPLQGLWNAIIFAATSWRILGEEVRERRVRWGFGAAGGDRLGGGHGGGEGGEGRRGEGGLGGQGATSGGGGGFRSRRESVLEGRELPTLPRMGNVRVIRGGSL